MAKYSIGIDYETLFGHSLLVNTETGEAIASATKEYTHGIMDDGVQHPMDYLEVVTETIPTLIKESGVNPEDIIGIGVNFPAGTVLPVLKDGTPLCFFNEFSEDNNAYAKLPDHVTSNDELGRFNDIAGSRSEAFLARYGGKAGAAWMVPKIMEIANESPKVYDTCDFFVEAADWIVWQLTGRQSRSSSLAGLNGLWSKKEGYPSDDFFTALSPKMANFVGSKLDCPVSAVGSRAGTVSPFVARATGLSSKTAVAVGNDSLQVKMAALGIDKTGVILTEVNKKTRHLLINSEEVFVPGVDAMAEDGIYPGFFGYKADNKESLVQLKWFKKNFSTEDNMLAKALEVKAGENALVVLDGVTVGTTTKTKPLDIYRALVESAVFETKKTIASFTTHGIPVNDFYITGSVAAKNPKLVQMFADVLNMPVKTGDYTNTSALGSAIFGALAAGSEAGGYDDILEAARAMGHVASKTYYPAGDAATVYKKLYEDHERLDEYFNGGANDCLKRLKNLRNLNGFDETVEEEVDYGYEDDFEEVPTLASEFGITEEEEEEELPLLDDIAPVAETEADAEDAVDAADTEETADAAETTVPTDIYSFSEDDVTDEIRANAEREANELFKAIDDVVREINDAELHAIFDDLIREEADRETEELLKAIDETVKANEDANHMAIYGDLIEEEAERHTQEIITAAEEVANLLKDTDLDAAQKFDEYPEFPEEVTITAEELEAKEFSDTE